MKKEYKYNFHGVSERDMDILFLQAFSIFPEFVKLFIDQTEWKNNEFVVTGVELSKTESKLGESDITVYVQLLDKKIALLIENKIDAIAMPEQHERYIRRGEKAVKKKEISSFSVFIVCSNKYYRKDDEAKKYEHHVSYEECLAFFKNQDSISGQIFAQQIQQALECSKFAPKVEINEIAVQSFAKYIEYQRKYYPNLIPRNDASSGKGNGWWPEFKVSLPYAIIIHKTPNGVVDLTFGSAAPKLEILQKIAERIRKYNDLYIEAAKTGKSAALRIRVPIIEMGTPFDTWNHEDLRLCFEAVEELMNIATLINHIKKLYE